jgi:hypothetical protein
MKTVTRTKVVAPIVNGSGDEDLLSKFLRGEEEPISMRQAGEENGLRINGKAANGTRVRQLCTAGVDGVVLESRRIGGRRCTSRQAVERFLRKLAERDAERQQAGTRGERVSACR